MSKKFTTDSPTMEEIIRRKKPNRASCDILMDPDIKHRIERKQAEVDKLKSKIEWAKSKRNAPSLADRGPREDEEKLTGLEEELMELYELADEETVTFTFQDIGRLPYDTLIAQHPPTPEQIKEYEAEAKRMGMSLAEAGGLAFNPQTFPPALMAAASYEPEISAKQSIEIFGGVWKEGTDEEEHFPGWSEGDTEKMFFTAMQACKERTSIPFTKPGIEGTPDSGPNLTTVPNEESPTASS